MAHGEKICLKLTPQNTNWINRDELIGRYTNPTRGFESQVTLSRMPNGLWRQRREKRHASDEGFFEGETLVKPADAYIHLDLANPPR